uniref:Sorting nexin 6 n=1 Tax=Rhinolophus ferrumequinum TaxID=59479 RepID=A0A671DRP7_RHIFE
WRRVPTGRWGRRAQGGRGGPRCPGTNVSLYVSPILSSPPSPRAPPISQEGLDDGPDFLSEEDRGLKAINVDLQSDAALQVDISDALSERDKVKFTVHTKSSLPNFKQNEFSVVRQHEEFIWLHDSFVENEDYAGYIIPPAPPRPDFDASREKLQKLGEGEGSMTKEEFTKMKQELEAGWITENLGFILLLPPSSASFFFVFTE